MVGVLSILITILFSINTSVVAQLGRAIYYVHLPGGRRDGLMVGALNSGVHAPGSSPGRGHCVVFLGKTLNCHGASLHPGV